MAQGQRQMLDIEEIHAELLQMLCAFDAFCRSRGIEYSIIAGTLLGAVRHKGFIPWDDDADVGLLRGDYNQLVSLADEFRVETGLMLCGYAGVPIGISPVCRISNPRIATADAVYEDEGLLSIDLSPFDFMPQSPEETLALCRSVARPRRLLQALCTRPEASAGAAVRAVKRIAMPLHKSGALKRSVAERIKSRATSVAPYSTPYVGSVSWGFGGASERIRARSFLEKTDLEFEGASLMAMSGYDEYLASIYGGWYMNVPPEGDRTTHGTQAWYVEEVGR